VLQRSGSDQYLWQKVAGDFQSPDAAGRENIFCTYQPNGCLNRAQSETGGKVKSMQRLYLSTLLILALAVTSTISSAQQRGAASGDDKSTDRSEIVRKNLAPVSKDVLKVKFPKAQEKTLSNGLTVLIIED